MTHEQWMQKAITMSRENIQSGTGGPFAALIVRNGELISAATNSVTTANDPTAHAEVNAIREACRKIGSFQLDGCDLYTSCEPCPMCLGAIYWSRLDRIFYANTRDDAAEIDFDDKFIYDEIGRPPSQRNVKMMQLLRDEAIVAFKEWQTKTDKVLY